ncbi:MAG: prepilin-type N-terminal cleavage/methylation domain-containing protein [Candidatus Omnitrophota bacterium]|nr:prepilin-type N-terminal cleavage/methylation domain-containing protein [Candidatus Omnitrophota bacterium]
MTSRTGNNIRGGFPYLEHGLTMIEVMLTVIVLAVGLTGVIRAYIVSLDALRASGDYIDAVSLAGEKMIAVKQEEIENGGLPQGKSQGKFPDGHNAFNWELEIDASGTAGLNTAKVTVFNELAYPVREFSLVSYVENRK